MPGRYSPADGFRFNGPLNVGSDEMVTINQLAEMVMEIAGKKLSFRHISGPLGVRAGTQTIA